MPYIDPKAVTEAKRMDLLTYLRYYEPEELIYVSSNVYSTKTHDSIRISNGKWMWWSQGIGGRSALEYLVKVKGLSFVKAVETILQKDICIPFEVNNETKLKSKKLLLPKKCVSNGVITKYLANRGIDYEIISYCIEKGIMFESLPYHNLVFVGFDEEGEPKYGGFRSTNNQRLMGDLCGSNKQFSFRILGETFDEVHLFECPIDLLSYATLIKMKGGRWKEKSLISLAGVYAPKQKLECSKVPAALNNFFKKYSEVKRIILHFDNDYVGRKATNALIVKLSDKYEVVDSPPKFGKDYNDFLIYEKEKNRKRGKENYDL